jgi:hypothetical protein
MDQAQIDNMKAKAKEAREKKEREALAHASAVKAEVTQKNPGADETKITKLVKEILDMEKLDSDIARSRKTLDDLVIRKYKLENPAATGVSKDKIEKALTALTK